MTRISFLFPRKVKVILGFVSIVLTLAVVAFTRELNTVGQQYLTDYYMVSEVVDGDTIVVKQNNQEFRVRYIGVNAPESVKPNTPVQCFGKESSNFNKNLVLGKKVKLEADIQDEDRFGRKLRYVYLEDGSMVNKILLKEGYASVMTIPPNVRYSEEFVKLEEYARMNDLGLWRACR